MKGFSRLRHSTRIIDLDRNKHDPTCMSSIGAVFRGAEIYMQVRRMMTVKVFFFQHCGRMISSGIPIRYLRICTWPTTLQGRFESFDEAPGQTKPQSTRKQCCFLSAMNSRSAKHQSNFEIAMLAVYAWFRSQSTVTPLGHPPRDSMDNRFATRTSILP